MLIAVTPGPLNELWASPKRWAGTESSAARDLNGEVEKAGEQEPLFGIGLYVPGIEEKAFGNRERRRTLRLLFDGLFELAGELNRNSISTRLYIFATARLITMTPPT